MEDERGVLAERIVRAVEHFPGSRRSLAREASISHTSLNRFVAGTVRPSRETAGRIATALERLGEQMTDDAASIREALDPPQAERTPDGRDDPHE